MVGISVFTSIGNEAIFVYEPGLFPLKMKVSISIHFYACVSISCFFVVNKTTMCMYTYTAFTLPIVLLRVTIDMKKHCGQRKLGRARIWR